MKKQRIRKSGSPVCFLLCAAVIFLLCGCVRKSVFDGSRTSDETGFRMEYRMLDREETADLQLNEGDRLAVKISHMKGRADVTVGISGSQPVYRGTEQTDAEFTLIIPETGIYHISVTGHQAEGMVSFEKTEAEQ